MVALGHETLAMLAGGDVFPKRLKAGALALLGPLLARTQADDALPGRLRTMFASCSDGGANGSGGGGGIQLGGVGGVGAIHIGGSHTSGGGSTELDAADFEVGSVRLGCAIGFGGASVSHFDIVVDVVSGALREITAPPPSNMADYLLAQVNSMLKEQKPQHVLEAELATGLLCLGHAAARAPPALLEPRANAIVASMLAAAKAGRSEALRGCAARALELIAKVCLQPPPFLGRLPPTATRSTASPLHSRSRPPPPQLIAASSSDHPQVLTQPLKDSKQARRLLMSHQCALGARDEVVEMVLRSLTASLRGAYDLKAQLAAARRLQLPALHACAMLVMLPPKPPPKLLSAMVHGESP